MKTVSHKHRLHKTVIIRLFFFLLYSLPQPAITAGMENASGNTLPAQLVRIESVERIIVDIASWPDLVGKSMPVQMRIPHVPYVKGQCTDETTAAQDAVTLSSKLLQNARSLQLRNIERGTGFYLLADVIADDVDVGAEITALLLAANKSAEEQWCKPAVRASGKFRINRN